LAVATLAVRPPEVNVRGVRTDVTFDWLIEKYDGMH
jgi:hypothetical protein